MHYKLKNVQKVLGILLKTILKFRNNCFYKNLYSKNCRILYVIDTLFYCSRFQVECTSTWNPNTPHTYGKTRTEMSPRIASGRQHGGHKITTQPETPMVLFYIGGYYSMHL